LAAALVTFEDHGEPEAGATPARVRQLDGHSWHSSSGTWSLMATATILLALAGVTVYLLRPVPAELCLPLTTTAGAPLAVLALALACVPAGLAGRVADRVVRSGATELT
jgi:hypothetical protein